MATFARQFLADTSAILEQLRDEDVEGFVDVLATTRSGGGRLFLCGSGGGAGHASHAACDFRKLCGIEAYSVTDNVSELTARINDDGWDTSYAAWLNASRIRAGDCLLVFSVGGGDINHQVSVNLVEAMRLAKDVGASVVGVVGRDGGYAAEIGDACVVIPTADPDFVTAQTEGLQALIWHLVVSHPKLASSPTKWESMSRATGAP